MSELSKKVKTSLERIKNYNPATFSRSDSYYLAFSGGKDSCVCKALLDMAGVKYDAHYNVTSVDPPDLVRFIKEKHTDVSRDVPIYTDYGEGAYRGDEWIGKPISMWNLIEWKMYPPTRIARYCCEYLKESSGDGRLTVTGVRWAESANREKNQGLVTIYSQNKKITKDLTENQDFSLTNRGGVVLVNDNAESRDVVDGCVTRFKTCLNPIIDWTDRDVWEFIKAENIPVCDLYYEGFSRLGCIGCPMARQHGREREFARYPKYKNSYILAFEKMLVEREKTGKTTGRRFGNTGKDVFNWWMEYDILPGQYNMFEDDIEGDELL